ncbi:MAG: hypothetical protein UT94_C0024G0005 [Candidatus Uhrbacteria bacterium GW2011_GWF2_40_263]|nr:MAG: hypothetical protein UT94_C0024G0005 [Candidatus Uhrbacteria bacterium GW2011_GWF2_40_263]
MKIPKIKAPKKTTVKKRTWDWFSKYIRLRDCLFTTGEPDQCYCVSCGVRYEFKHTQAGHCIGGRNESILFDTRLVNGQCEDCNKSSIYGGRDGNYPAYHIWYIKRYGLEDFEEKEKISNLLDKLSVPELEELSDEFRTRFNALKKDNSLLQVYLDIDKKNIN